MFRFTIRDVLERLLGWTLAVVIIVVIVVLIWPVVKIE